MSKIVFRQLKILGKTHVFPAICYPKRYPRENPGFQLLVKPLILLRSSAALAAKST